MNVVIIYNDDKVYKFDKVSADHWHLIQIDDFINAKKLTVILNDKIRNVYDFTQDPEAFKNASFKV